MGKAVAFIFLFSFIGCITGPDIPAIKYNMKLASVERPKNAKERYGKVNNTVMTDEKGQQRMVFEDDLIKAFFLFDSDSVLFEVNNKTDFTIKINWDNAAYIDTSSTSMRVIHSGVRLMDRNSSQAPSIIVRKGKLVDSVTPSENIYFISGQYGGWKYASLFPKYNVESAKTYMGKSCSLLLPLEIEGVTNDYIFTFDVDNIILKNPAY